MTKALVVAGGDFPKNFKEKNFDYVLAVDRGLEYLLASEIDVERAKLARQRAQSHLEDQDNSDINRAKRALARAENRLRVAELK